MQRGVVRHKSKKLPVRGVFENESTPLLEHHRKELTWSKTHPSHDTISKKKGGLLGKYCIRGEGKMGKESQSVRLLSELGILQ